MSDPDLWVVATPIGNLEDLSPRARTVLTAVDIVAAEDTRVARRLFSACGIRQTCVAVHDHNERSVVPGLVERMRAGETLALISDAGTPLVSDPGYRLVAAACEAGLCVSPVPGPCAAVAALSVAGLPSDRFQFEGFLPDRAAARRRRLEDLADVTPTLVFYAPARDLPAVLADLVAVMGGQREAAVARELTKRFETVRRGGLESLAEWVAADADQSLGEAVVLVAGASEAGAAGIDARALARELATELPPGRAARILVRLTDLDRKAAYALVESLRRRDES